MKHDIVGGFIAIGVFILFFGYLYLSDLYYRNGEIKESTIPERIKLVLLYPGVIMLIILSLALFQIAPLFERKERERKEENCGDPSCFSPWYVPKNYLRGVYLLFIHYVLLLPEKSRERGRIMSNFCAVFAPCEPALLFLPIFATIPPYVITTKD